MRNSSLVQGFCAENVTGLKQYTEDAEWRKSLVGERSIQGEAVSKEAVDSMEERMPV